MKNSNEKVGLKNRLTSIADQHNIKVTFDLESEGENHGSSAGDEIFLGHFTNDDLLTIAFFHELAHCLSNSVLAHRTHCSSRLADEGFAWEYGFELAAQHGYTWDIEHDVYKYAERSLLSYVEKNTIICVLSRDDYKM